MENRLAVISIIIENSDFAEEINQLLHDNNSYIIGRMGIPYQKRNISVITIVIDAPLDVISSLSGKLGMLKGVSVKTMYSKEKA